MTNSSDDWTKIALSSSGNSVHYQFTLYVVGTTPRTARAIVNLRQLFEQHLPGRYDLEIVDIAQNPQIAVRDQVVAVPLLIRSQPLPKRRFVGDMSDTDKLLRGLEIIS